MNRLLAAALRLVDPEETTALVDVHTGRHAALYSLGRLDEADEEYRRTIEGLCSSGVHRVAARAVQARSLTHRNRYVEAIGLGLESLRELGIAVPTADRLPMELDRQFSYLYQWLEHGGAAEERSRPEGRLRCLPCGMKRLSTGASTRTTSEPAPSASSRSVTPASKGR
ncbi:hypothetical protein [Dactylosporangium sp. NPDC049140]|uniref:hypothetical protein n=1 Tax=Dactylosporangium sp. NPDC049140 TaxID=3155647 RepID=UPI0033DBFD1B